MIFEYGCFVSYVGAREALMSEFMSSLVKALRSEVEPYVRDEPVFVDWDRMSAGDRVDPALARGICRSACWVLVYVPQYWKSDYCLRELQAMLQLEATRRDRLGRHLDPQASMIIPVVLRGRREDLPARLGNSVNCLEFTGFTTATGDILRNEKYITKISELAAKIGHIYQLGDKLEDECAEFALPPPGPEIGAPPPPSPFPGRRRDSSEAVL